ncbi:transposase [Burkholderia sp. Bp9126]|nr:transposase [Burkholderia sp. Bp9126]
MSKTHTRKEMTDEMKDPTKHRRRWSMAEKLAIVRESFEPGESVSRVAARYDVSPNQLSGWRKRYRDQVLLAMKAGTAPGPASAPADVPKHGAGDDIGSNEK